MKTKAVPLGVMLTLGASFPMLASASWLDPADGYNLFLAGDLTSDSDTQGRVAAGGSVDVDNYSVGILASPSAYSLVAGGNVDYRHGSINNGGVYSGGDVYLDNHSVFGDVTAQGSVSFGPGGGTVTGSTNPGSPDPSPVDFASAFSYLNNTANTLGAMADTGTVSVSGGIGMGWANITLSGSDALNIFTIDAALLAETTSLVFNVGSNAALVNVTGTSASMGAFGINNGGNDGSNILFNFYQADSLAINNLGLWGSILAPGADLNFNSGQINGTVVAASATGTGQFNLNPFDHGDPFTPPPTTVPEPGTLLLLAGGTLIGFGVRRRREREPV